MPPFHFLLQLPPFLPNETPTDCPPTLMAMPTRRSTLGDRAFPVAAARALNSLPPACQGCAITSVFPEPPNGRITAELFLFHFNCTATRPMQISQTVDKTRGGFRHVQHVRPNRGPQKRGPPQADCRTPAFECRKPFLHSQFR